MVVAPPGGGGLSSHSRSMLHGLRLVGSYQPASQSGVACRAGRRILARSAPAATGKPSAVTARRRPCQPAGLEPERVPDGSPDPVSGRPGIPMCQVHP